MKKPARRPSSPERSSDNEKRALESAPDPLLLHLLSTSLRYAGSSKHKARPHLFGLPPYLAKRGDATLCDDHANFGPSDMPKVIQILRRGAQAGLIGRKGALLWAIGDDGWIFEARMTNAAQLEYHGYPVLTTEAIAEPVYRRFAAWALQAGDHQAQQAADNCRSLYGFKG